MEPTRRTRRSRRRTRRHAAFAALAAVVGLALIGTLVWLAGRGDDTSSTTQVVALPTTKVSAPATTTVVTAPSTTAVTTPSSSTTTTTGLAAPPPTDGAAAPVAPSAPPAESTTPAPLTEAGDADQVVVVTASDYGQTTATLSAYERVNGAWHLALGPWDANIGFQGFAPPNEKTEGDGRTPSGSFGFDFLFGVQSDPGVHFPYRTITDSSIVWDDDPASPRYNQWVDTRTEDAGLSPEPMYELPAYSYGAVIAYNDAGVPGLGSAIFLHVSTGSATAGCVSLPADDLLAVLRWLDPSRHPRIVMGTQSM
jgi:L,D-peptidoglycan transpeptidase YkuD (ErfK/YbiS/YcfS/YnhG family)